MLGAINEQTLRLVQQFDREMARIVVRLKLTPVGAGLLREEALEMAQTHVYVVLIEADGPVVAPATPLNALRAIEQRREGRAS